MVPQCYRQLAIDEQDPAKAKAWHEKSLETANSLIALATKAGEDAGPSKQTGELFAAFALAALERWPEALTAIDAYLKAYPENMILHGAEFRVKIDAHLALKQLPAAEAALAAMVKKAPTGSSTRAASWAVFSALYDAYKKLETGPERVSMAGRAAAILEQWLETQKDVGWDLKYRLGEVLFDAQRYGDAAEAYEAAVVLAPVERKQQITLAAAEASYQASEHGAGLSAAEKVKNLAKVRDLFTDVLIPPDPKDPEKKEQGKILQALGNPGAWPSQQIFDRVKKMPRELYVAAEIYTKSQPAGIDGRQVALRLIYLLHQFTIPSPQEGKKNLEEYIPTWWDAAELKLRTYLAIAQSGTGPDEKEAATAGLGYARKLAYENPKMDGPQRVSTFAALEAQLKTLAR